ncbi:MAG: PQQ-binding-like beta-propeller repeat protein [Planctomycetaceae bacterium]|jgi:outer membrane protein assembly factor BamB|nr:PQQ-binding-like beta-propeller repeat protein [Planctomycetaceae bacterium]MBT6485599.1 PQQ-binding-like beta-propeller repeat protein [Planctomycetaceae bacterium]MBT6493136.1 PQQ-binding-like beta-propeller repeat protein [Planctomycetaceae bacterium]
MLNRMMAVLIGLSLTATAVAGEPAQQQNWPRWRGPGDNGSTAIGKYPASFSSTKNVLWKTELPGLGCSTPIVWNGKIMLTCAAEGQDALLAFDWSGKKRWTTTIGRERKGKHRNGSGSNPSAATDGSHVFVYFKSGNLAGLDLDGKLLWKTNLQERFGKDSLYWDLGTSPVLTKTDVVVAIMHKGESFLLAFDKLTGELHWKTSRNYKTPVEGDHSYATPIVVQRDGHEIILVWGAEHVTAHTATDGRELWACGGFNPEERGNWVAVASFVLVNDVAVIPYGRGSRLAGVSVGGSGDVTATHRRWTREDSGSFVPTPAAAGGRVFVVRDKGEVECVNAVDGKTVWKGAFPKNRAKYYASPTIADGKLYAPREDGVLMVANIADGFNFLSENNMGERLIASPVPVDSRLLIRGERHLFAIGQR